MDHRSAGSIGLRVNPYLATTIAMCVIVMLSLAGTAYVAIYFNRRAKADLLQALQPLAEVIDGTVNLDSAEVSGRHEGDLVFGRVATGAGGIGRLFQIDRIDAAGGHRWEWSSLPSRTEGREPTRTFESEDPTLERRLGLDWQALSAAVSNAERERFGFLYDPTAGHVRLARAMRTRNDIPDAAAFLDQLHALLVIARANRATQQGGGEPAVAEESTGGDVP